MDAVRYRSAENCVAETCVRESEPGYVRGKPCVYIGLTVKTAEERYTEHKAGTRDGRFVKRYGKRVRVSDCRRLRSMTRKRAEKKEAALASRLRSRGWGVWSN